MFVRAGAKLADKDKAHLKELNTQISALQTQFRQRVLAATKEGAVVVEDVKQLDGCTPEQISAAAESAKSRGMAGKWLITLQNTTQQPALEQLPNRELRQRIFEASARRARRPRARRPTSRRRSTRRRRPPARSRSRSSRGTGSCTRRRSARRSSGSP